MTFADCQLNAVTVDPAGIVSDHALVVCRLTTINTAPTTAERLVRGWRRADRSQIRHLVTASRLCQPVPDDADVEEPIAIYDAVLRDIADKLAPVHTVRRRPGRPTTTNAALNAATVGFSSAATDVRGAPRTVDFGSTLHVAGCV